MALLVLPLWTIEPDWSREVTETLEWLTNVFMSPTGAEQRQSMRLAPRRWIEFGVAVAGVDAGFFNAFLDQYGGGEFYLPLWHESGRLTRSVAAGSVSGIVTGEKAEMAACDAACIALTRPYGWPVAEITAGVTGGGATFLSAEGAGWSAAAPKGSKVYPMARARLDGSSVSFDRRSDGALTAQVRFELLDPQDWSGTPGFDEYLTYPVLDIETNEARGQSATYNRLFANLDNQTGVRSRVDMAGWAFPTFNQGSTFIGRGRADFIRSALYAMKGRRNQAWFPSPMADFVLRAPVEPATAQFLVTRNGFTDTGGPAEGRSQVRFLYRDGTSHYKEILSSAIVDDGDTELITVDSTFGEGFSIEWPKRISLLYGGRFDQDRFEIVHVTDTDGVCEVSASVRRVPDLRSAGEWDPPAFPDDEMTG